jgi:hypothetical protein
MVSFNQVCREQGRVKKALIIFYPSVCSASLQPRCVYVVVCWPAFHLKDFSRSSALWYLSSFLLSGPIVRYSLAEGGNGFWSSLLSNNDKNPSLSSVRRAPFDVCFLAPLESVNFDPSNKIWIQLSSGSPRDVCGPWDNCVDTRLGGNQGRGMINYQHFSLIVTTCVLDARQIATYCQTSSFHI